MNYLLIVKSSPYNTESSITVYLFAKALINKNHTLKSIFFYSDGVFHAIKTNFSNVRNTLINKWNKLSSKYNVKLYICTNAMLKRNLISHSDYSNQNQTRINSCFLLSGLAVLIDEMQKCDRIIQL